MPYRFSLTFTFFCVLCCSGYSQNTNLSLTANEKYAVIEETGQFFKDNYLFPEKGLAIRNALQDQCDAGEFDSIVDPELFRSMLQKSIRSVVDDRHIIVIHHNPDLEHTEDKEVSPWLLEFDDRKAINFGIPELQVLDGNIGYIKIAKFTSPQLFDPAMAAASKFLRNVDGLVLDLRTRGGGRSETVGLLLSYFLPPNTHTLTWHYRDAMKSEKDWTLPIVSGHCFPDIPVAILTSDRTFSGSEAFTYVMKHHGRAFVVGEKTRGGAHTYKEMLVQDRFLLLMPIGRAVSSVTHQNWEGKGVVPTINVPAEEALEVAIEKLGDTIGKTQ